MEGLVDTFYWIYDRDSLGQLTGSCTQSIHGEMFVDKIILPEWKKKSCKLYCRLVCQMARLNGLHNVLSHVPSRLHKMSMRLGDSVSRNVALQVLDDVSKDYDEPVRQIKEQVESLWMGGLSDRARKAMARRLNITGSAFFGDNVGKVRIKWICQFEYFSLVLSMLGDTVPFIASKTCDLIRTKDKTNYSNFVLQILLS
jgi:hypothetical protein